MAAAVQATYAQKMSVTSGTSSTEGKLHVWSDMELKVSSNGRALVVCPKSVNKAWLFEGAAPEKSRVRWMGVGPIGLGGSRAVLLGRIARSAELKLKPNTIKRTILRVYIP